MKCNLGLWNTPGEIFRPPPEERGRAFTADDQTVKIAFPANDTDEAVTYNVFVLWQVSTAGSFGTMYYIDHLSPEGVNAILAYCDAAIAVSGVTITCYINS